MLLFLYIDILANVNVTLIMILWDYKKIYWDFKHIHNENITIRWGGLTCLIL